MNLGQCHFTYLSSSKLSISRCGLISIDLIGIHTLVCACSNTTYLRHSTYASFWTVDIDYVLQFGEMCWTNAVWQLFQNILFNIHPFIKNIHKC
jgi:hypothetical protein